MTFGRFAEMKTIALTQSADYPTELIETCPFDVKVLTYKQPHPTSTFAPDTTWTQGRNILLSLINPADYDYIILMDDDLEFKRGSWRKLLEYCEKHRPEIAVPNFEWHVQNDRVDAFDAMLNLYRGDTIHKYLPYNDRYDDESWYYSQLLVYDKVLTHLPDGVHHIMDVVINNTAHALYPRGMDFQKVIDENFVNKGFYWDEMGFCLDLRK